MIIFDLAQKYGRYSHYPIRAGPDAFVFTAPIDGYMGSTFKQLWVSETLHLPYVLACIRFYKDELRNSKKGAAIPHLNKDIFRNLIIGIPPLNEQLRMIKAIDEIISLL